MKNSKITKALQYLQEKHYADFANSYGEPGYADPEKGIIFANWNDVPKGLADWLEKCGYSLEWCDEWMVDYANGCKAYRTIPDSHHWESQIMLPAESCEYITPDDSPETWIDACAVTSPGQPIYCLPAWMPESNILENGFTLINADLENGFFAGMDDSPEKISKALFDNGAYRVIFKKRENSQFYIRFAVYADMMGE